MTRPLRALVADDDRVSMRLLSTALTRWSIEPVIARDGQEAWRCLTGGNPPTLAVLDWMMPWIDGPTLCRRIRSDESLAHMYVVLLTGRAGRANLVAGLEAGADDYIVKPFDYDELHARLHVGLRVLALQQRLSERVVELQAALSHVKRLSGLLPICCYCKRIRSDQDYWEQVESYIAQRSEAEFTHGICPSCLQQAHGQLESWKSET